MSTKATKTNLKNETTSNKEVNTNQVTQTTASEPLIKVKIDRLSTIEGSKVKAFASATINNAFTVHGLRIIEGEKGKFVAMPSTSYQKDGKTEYQETFHPVSSEARKTLTDAVMAAYENKLSEEQSPVNDLDESEDLPFTQKM